MPINDGYLFPPSRVHQAPIPNSMIPITTVRITTPIARFWCELWLSGLFLDVRVDATLGSVEDFDLGDWDEEKDESEGE